MRDPKILAFCLVVAAILYFSKKDDKSRVSNLLKRSVKSKSIKQGSSQKTVTASDADSNAEASVKNSKTNSSILDPTKGLCFYSLKGTEKLISLKLARHLKSKSPGYLVLPAAHGECLKKFQKSDYLIVNYDPVTDEAYDNFGSVSLSLSPHEDYLSYEEFLLKAGDKIKDFGFQDQKEMADYFSEQGYFRFVQKNLVSFKVQEVFSWRTAPVSGTYEAYPGLELISMNEAKSRTNYNHATVIDMTDPKEIFPNTLKGIQERFKSIEGMKVVHPQRVKQLVHSPVLDQISKESEVILLGSHPNDMRVFNLSGLLYSQGHQKVSAVKGGIYGANNIDISTPFSVSGLNLITADSVIRDSKNYLVLDSRSSRAMSSYFIEGSYSVPYTFPPGMRRSDDFYKNIKNGETKIKPKFNVSSFINIDQLKMILNNRPILLVPAHEYDWSAIVLGLYIKENMKANIYWFREGMKKIENMHTLGFLSDEDLKRGMIQLSDDDEEKEVTTSEQGKVILLSRKSKLNVELRPGKRI